MRLSLLLTLGLVGLSAQASEPSVFLRDKDYPTIEAYEEIPDNTVIVFHANLSFVNKHSAPKTVRTKEVHSDDISYVGRKLWSEMKKRVFGSYQYVPSPFVCDVSMELPALSISRVLSGDQYAVSFAETESYRDRNQILKVHLGDVNPRRKGYVFVSSSGQKLILSCFSRMGNGFTPPHRLSYADVDKAFNKDPEQPVIYIGPRLNGPN